MKPGDTDGRNTRRTSRAYEVAVDIADIDPGYDICRMSFAFNAEYLARSIAQAGLLNSPMVLRTPSGGVGLITGYRRFVAVKELGWKNLPCRDISGDGISPGNLLLMNFYDNMTTRRFNDIEKAMILSRLSEHFSEKDILKTYMPLLDLPGGRPVFDVYRRLDRELDVREKKEILEGGVSVQALEKILDLDKASRVDVIGLIKNLNMNVNYQKQLIDYLIDLSHINHSTIHSILQENHISDMTGHARMNRPQKTKALMGHLRQRRFPVLTQAEQDFRAVLSGLDLPVGATIRHSPYFESPDFTLELRFRDGLDLDKKLQRLTREKGLRKIRDPWALEDS